VVFWLADGLISHARAGSLVCTTTSALARTGRYRQAWLLAWAIRGQRPGKWIEGLLRLRGVSQAQQEFAEFYEASRDACLRAVIAGSGDARQAEDMVAEAFARAWASWAKVRRYSAPRGWVVRSALNTGVSWWRPRRREIPLASHDAAALAYPAEGLDAAVLAALRRLPTRQREVIALRVFLDLDTQATAEVLGIAPGTVTAHLSRAATALRREPALRGLVVPSRADTTHDGGQQ
jgi:RNA polymerase sigma factor (sigma-70 family)